jgi:hypothetical protein
LRHDGDDALGVRAFLRGKLGFVDTAANLVGCVRALVDLVDELSVRLARIVTIDMWRSYSKAGGDSRRTRWDQPRSRPLTKP